ncbi:MAG: recombinase family protein [Flavonifractor plautii]
MEWIAEQMEKAGIPTPDNAPYWQKTSILYILTNEKYIGDSLNQKYLSGGFPFLKRRNHSEADQYYIENTHPAIVSRETFEKVQQLLQRKGARQRMEHPVPPWSGRSGAANAGLCSAVGRGVAVW